MANSLVALANGAKYCQNSVFWCQLWKTQIILHFTCAYFTHHTYILINALSDANLGSGIHHFFQLLTKF